jgi:hypothetical protein
VGTTIVSAARALSRRIWLGQVAALDTFINNRRVARGEKKRLEPERSATAPYVSWPTSTPRPVRSLGKRADMARITDTDRTRNEAAVRAAMERLLRGDVPPGGKCDLKTLATLAGVIRTSFYPKKHRAGTPRHGPYEHLAEEFEQRMQELQDAGEIIDPRDAQVDRLKKQVDELKERISTRDERLAELTEFRTLAISRLAAQHDEVERLRAQVAESGTLRALPKR